MRPWLVLALLAACDDERSARRREPRERREPSVDVDQVVPFDAMPVYQLTPLPSGQYAVRVDSSEAAARAYDQQAYDEAIAYALEALVKTPDNIRAMRIVVSSACALGQVDLAVGWTAKLPAHDREQMRRRCDRYGITLP